MTKNSVQDEVLFETKNDVKIITLNRPRKLNSLNLNMCSLIFNELLRIHSDPSIKLIILQSNIPKAFCAGGDVVECCTNNLNDDILKSCELFYFEYSMNYLLTIYCYEKPIISFINGITMGGGVGLSCHTPFRIATNTTRLAMPEMFIGFFPDVGTTFLLPKLDDHLGYYLALTGEQLLGYDNLIAGTATHFIDFEKFDDVKNDLVNLSLSHYNNIDGVYNEINNVLENYSNTIPSDHKFKYSIHELKLIDQLFTRFKNDIDGLFNELESHKATNRFYQETLDILLKGDKSLLSLKLSFNLLKLGSNSNNYDALKQELISAQNIMINKNLNDFNEGVNKKLILKTNNPIWKFESIHDISKDQIDYLLKLNDNIPYPDLAHGDISIKKFDQYPYNYTLPKDDEILSKIRRFDLKNKKDIIDHLGTKKGTEWKVNYFFEKNKHESNL
ncbi:mitochondrial 37S ribosomal protein mS47 [Ascoidea rubescens DSM 1968]|uniref:3-hydroxyisobutyryl-CoA hydrolase n=1 Tax=Ascoidea rubescens DSM 1968 TaxID=1344418 RepID=A0A1D2VQQ2_9ASCO|nr:ClpP/crotonase [Ascoidea rubescens DSM 1968]ODV63932.1 ClpP/crotonase [Ascoidea rubescens DSM 1968]